MRRIKPLLIGLYDYNHLGLRYLSSRLKSGGYEPVLFFVKRFASHKTTEPSPGEYRLLAEKARELAPDFIGISVMSSLYLQVAIDLTRILREATGAPVLWGGVHPTLFPEESLEYADFVIRGEGEDALLEFCDLLAAGRDWRALQNLCYREEKTGEIRINPLRPLRQDLDGLPFPDLGPGNKYYLAGNGLVAGEPLAGRYSYELIGSRGCPYRCSFCCNAGLRDLYRGKGRYLRLRSVENVIAEIKEARENLPRLSLLRFWDEIFPAKREWVEEFARRYRQEVGLPFEIWGHPNHIEEENIKRLVAAGLEKIVVGFQSGSPRVRKEIYNRGETQEQILAGGRILAAAGVPVVVYDLILDHPFETPGDLRETLEFCLKIPKPFRLQLHGLSLLPGTAVRRMAVEKGARTPAEIEAEFRRPLLEQYRDIHWWRRGRGARVQPWKTYWYTLIYLSQFPLGEKIIRWARKGEEKPRRKLGVLLGLQRLFNYYLLWKLGTEKLKLVAGGKKQRASMRTQLNTSQIPGSS
ncbi:MAG: B12-binding domain-containing radical SAM protein [Firmicutes bacterium]|nr:B12-binding domain-containing radical SAM protein [Bacillota bacterium]